MNLAPSCSSITLLRYWGDSWLNPVTSPWLPRCLLPLPTADPCCLLTLCPQACKNNICLDLSPGHGLDGRLTGYTVETWGVKVCVCACGWRVQEM